MENSRWDKLRVLTLALIFSGALNIGLFLTLAFSALDHSSASTAFANMKTAQGAGPVNCQILREMLTMSFSELVVFLTNRDPVEDGYAKRDLALSVLTHAHAFNLEKALSGCLPQKRLISIAPEQMIAMYPGINDEQYEAIIRYAYQEKWPLTGKGLFLTLKKHPKNMRDDSLCSAFWGTPEFYALQVLFLKTDAPQDPMTLLDLVCEGPWEVLERFAVEQAELFDLSLNKRREILLNYIAYRSKVAASLLLSTDFVFAKSRLQDAGILALLGLLGEPTELARSFCVDLLRSPRTDAVLQAAAEKLYQFSGEAAPVPFELVVALQRFAPSAAAEVPVVLSGASASKKAAVKETFVVRMREHVVLEGETLWKIARHHKVKVEELIRVNALEKDRLIPGMVLRIPQGTGSEPPG